MALGFVFAVGGRRERRHSGATTEPGGTQTSGGTLVFGVSNDPRILDPALASDGESLRVSGQIFETLVTTAPGSTEVVPAARPRVVGERGRARLDVRAGNGSHVPRW